MNTPIVNTPSTSSPVDAPNASVTVGWPAPVGWPSDSGPTSAHRVVTPDVSSAFRTPPAPLPSLRNWAQPTAIRPGVVGGAATFWRRSRGLRG